MYDEIANVVERTPIIAGIEAIDPRYLRLPRLLESFRVRGYDGMINFPTIANYAERRRMREDVGLGFSREIALVRLARDEGFFSMVYAFNPEDAAAMAEAGADVVVAHVGWTAGGLVGATASAPALDLALEQAQSILEAALKVNPDVVPLAHGGPLVEPEDTRRLYRETSAVGFVGASSIERIPIERAIMTAVAGFKSIPLG
jgi:predicted TIM-barrel enzyme